MSKRNYDWASVNHTLIDLMFSREHAEGWPCSIKKTSHLLPGSLLSSNSRSLLQPSTLETLRPEGFELVFF